MATIKNNTDVSQSLKLAEFLPIESADNYYSWHDERYYVVNKDCPYPYSLKEKIPCWSLAALLNILPYPQLYKDKLGSGKTGWIVNASPNDCRYVSCWHDNPVDACCELILKLHELKML